MIGLAWVLCVLILLIVAPWLCSEGRAILDAWRDTTEELP